MVGDIDRRAKQIAARNPGHPASAALQAAREEIAAIHALKVADEAGQEAAQLHLSAMQLRAANLDLDHDAACELARLHLETPKHWMGL
ncbi:hypothetical protein CG471_21740 [Sphingobium sp. IP1]|uniref:hypothetical protein n=1 Tax=Sphingobium sp. IP1 TaxID=2021637 RepID=UPI000C0685D8|nr:hypothetical protein [Sphingobium sp. IP1]PHP17647.1 hypothetical protein CG471_21740 [Sphingobium sp. IP1]